MNRKGKPACVLLAAAGRRPYPDTIRSGIDTILALSTIEIVKDQGQRPWLLLQNTQVTLL